MGMTFITGASSGIGRSLARRIAADGAPVVVVARRKPLLDGLVEEIAQAGGRALAIACDVTDRAAVRDAVRQAEAHFGPTARLVANAGGALPSADGFSVEHLTAVVDVNLIGVANCIDAVLPGMLERRAGHLVAVSSLAASRGLPGSAAYSAAKAGLNNMMESLRIDLRGQGIDVTIIAPGFVRTKPGTKRKRNKPLRLELEPATQLIHRAIIARKPYYAFPKSLVMLVAIARLLPAALYDRILAGRGPQPKG